MTVRIEISFTLAAAVLLASASARADEYSRFRPEVARHAAQDGRGETSEGRSTRVAVDRPATVRIAPEHVAAPTMRESSHSNLPLRSELKVRFGEERDHVAPAAVSTAALPAPAAQPNAGVVQRAAKLPIKSEILVRVNDTHDGEDAVNPMQSSSKGQAQKGVARATNLRNLPIKSEVKMKMAEGGDGNEDSL